MIKKCFHTGRGNLTGDVQELTKHNSADAYNKLWANEKLLKNYLEPARVESYRFMATYSLEKMEGTKIVELGFGSADFLKILLEMASPRRLEVYGLDYAKSGVKRASKLIPNGNFTCGNIYRLPYSEGYFDAVFCMQTLEHLESPDKALDEMDRICTEDGIVIVSVPNGELNKTFEGHLQFWGKDTFVNFLSPREVLDCTMFNNDRGIIAAYKPLKKDSE